MVKTPTWSRRLPRVRYLPSMASGHSPCMTRSILGAERVAVDRVRVEEIPNVQRGWFADALCKRQIARQGQRKQLAACTERGPFSLYIRAYWADKPILPVEAASRYPRAVESMWPMSAFGTKRTSRPAQSMSAFGGKADIGWRCRNVCF